MRYWVTVSVPVEAESAGEALDLGWEKLIDPEGPPEGLKEHVADGEPTVISPNLLDGPEFADSSNSKLATRASEDVGGIPV